MQLSLQSHQHNVKTMCSNFRSTFGDDEINALGIDEMKFDTDSGQLPEPKLYQDIMMTLYFQVKVIRVADADIAQLEGLFGQLSVTPITRSVTVPTNQLGGGTSTSTETESLRR
ncbi:hypothetical protein N657DRAFT_645842 [Parathielavia appendiculata]|uniref:Uncharacterized protein n=1 Tax=Parathielavia appendiculata TaxID=2587402 RepID=A0AAN6TZG6_9PEZI|nr:hypothetical protein N657DRAFT_645842 [Parathielavia appendiculata]